MPKNRQRTRGSSKVTRPPHKFLLNGRKGISANLFSSAELQKKLISEGTLKKDLNKIAAVLRNRGVPASRNLAVN